MHFKKVCGAFCRPFSCIIGGYMVYSTVKEVIPMAVRLNEDKEVVARIKEGLKAKDGYCPCRLPRIEEFKCICKEFREQIADPDFEGYCHCMLYYKSKD